MKTSVGKRQTLQFYNNNSDIKVLIISGPPGGINKRLSFISSQSIVAAFTNQHFIVRVLKTAWNDSPRSKMQLYGWEICKIASTHNIRYKVEWGWQMLHEFIDSMTSVLLLSCTAETTNKPRKDECDQPATCYFNQQWRVVGGLHMNLRHGGDSDGARCDLGQVVPVGIADRHATRFLWPKKTFMRMPTRKMVNAPTLQNMTLWTAQ